MIKGIKKSVRHLSRRIVGLHELRDENTELHAGLNQLQDAFVQMGGLPIPPPHLQTRVTGRYPPDFISHGAELISDLDRILKPRELSSFKRVLDFGSGCGRVLRAFHFRKVEGQELYGTDIDIEAIDWCRKNYEPVATFSANGHEPPTKYADGFFDLVYAISVFTHLPEDLQYAWLAELRRIVKPGGLLILSFHGDYCLSKWPLTMEEYERIKLDGFCYSDHGPTLGLPDFYRMTYHSQNYVRTNWSRYFEILDLGERSVHNFQDAALCRVS